MHLANSKLTTGCDEGYEARCTANALSEHAFVTEGYEEKAVMAADTIFQTLPAFGTTE